jgi:hypothetical protein
VRSGLAHIDPYFQKLADGMVAWISCWQKLGCTDAASGGGGGQPRLLAAQQDADGLNGVGA